jgi:WD40 repeat protein
MRKAGIAAAARACGAIVASSVLLLSMGDKTPAEQPAAPLPTEPMLNIDAKGHGTQIFRIATDRAERFAVTASSDKTVRIWSLPDGQLKRVLRLPSGREHLGKAFAVALSPDGATVAVGGWTGPLNSMNIFLFDLASGVLRKRLGGLPTSVTH